MTQTILKENGITKGTGKRRRAKLIASDVWGSSAYYSAEVLERDASTVVVPGIKMFENHQTYTEEMERPEGDVSKLIGKITSYGMYEPDNPEGPGIYADVEFYDSYVDRINEIGGDIGLSINGVGDYVEGEKDGRFGKIITNLVQIKSVDVVTAAGAGGKLVSIIESAGPMAGTPVETEGEQAVEALTKEEFTEGLAKMVESMKEAFAENIETLRTALKEAEEVEEKVEAEEGEKEEADADKADAETPEPADAEEDEKKDEDEDEVDLEDLTTKFIESGLPSVVMSNVFASVRAGKTVDEAIAEQTKLREAFMEHSMSAGSVRITEASGKTEPSAQSTKDIILNIFKDKE